MPRKFTIKEIDHFMATKKAASKGAKKSGTARKGSASKKGGASKKGASKKGASKKAAAKKGGVKAVASSQGSCTGWDAVQDAYALTPQTLLVRGRCTFPTHGYQVTLQEAVPQGIVPENLLLDKIVTPPTGIVIQTPETIEVQFRRRARIKYTDVTIRPEGTTIKVRYVR
jgi:hypothetical protein